MLPEAVSRQESHLAVRWSAFALAHASEVDGPVVAKQSKCCPFDSRRCESKGERLARLHVASTVSKEPVRTLKSTFSSSYRRVFDGPGLSPRSGLQVRGSLAEGVTYMPTTARSRVASRSTR